MLRSPTAIGENFFQNEKKLSRIIFFFIENVGFYFAFPSFLESVFFLAFLSATFYIFFGSSMAWRFFVCFAIYFFFIVMKRHNRFFELVTSVLSQRDVVRPWVGYINYTSYLRKSGSFCSICGFYQHVVFYLSKQWKLMSVVEIMVLLF